MPPPVSTSMCKPTRSQPGRAQCFPLVRGQASDDADAEMVSCCNSAPMTCEITRDIKMRQGGAVPSERREKEAVAQHIEAACRAQQRSCLACMLAKPPAELYLE